MTGVGTLESRPELAAALAIYTSALARAPAACYGIMHAKLFLNSVTLRWRQSAAQGENY